MRILKEALLAVVLVGAMSSCPIVADEDEPPLITSVTHEPQAPPPFKSKSLAAKVEEAVQHIAKTDDSSWLNYLQEQHEKSPDVVLNLLKPYIKHPSSQVRRALVRAAYTKGTRTAFDMMVILCADHTYEIRSYAAALLQNDYSHQQLVKLGGARFHHTLVWSFTHDPHGESDNEALMLGLFGQRKDVETLRRRLNRYQTSAMKNVIGAERQRIRLELALSRLGEKEASERLLQRFESKDKGQLVELLGHLRWFPNQELFSRALELLKDKRNEFDVPPPPPGSDIVIRNLRICDIAFSSFWRILPIHDLKVQRRAPWPDEQLNAAYASWQKELPNFVAHSSKVQWVKVF